MAAGGLRCRRRIDSTGIRQEVPDEGCSFLTADHWQYLITFVMYYQY